MKVTFNEYIQNPMGNKTAVFTQREALRAVYKDKFDKIITELNELSEEQKEQVYKYLQVKKANKHSKKDRF